MQRIITAVIVLAAMGIVSAFERDHLSRSGEAADCAAANPVVTVTTPGQRAEAWSQRSRQPSHHRQHRWRGRCLRVESEPF